MSTATRARRKQGKNGKRRPGGAEQGGAVGPTVDTNVTKTVTVSAGSLGPLQVFLEVPDGVPVSFSITRTDKSLTVPLPDDPTEEVPDVPTGGEVEVSSDEDEEPMPTSEGSDDNCTIQLDSGTTLSVKQPFSLTC